MPCQDAMIDSEVITALPETTLEEVIELFEKHTIRSIPIVNNDGILVGLFNFHRLLTTILPISADNQLNLRIMRRMNISLDHVEGQSGWLAGRLKDNLQRPIKDIMVPNPKVVHPDTPLREGVRLMAQFGSPLAVTDEETGKFIGLVSTQSALKVLLAMKTDLKRGKPIEEFEE